MASPVTIDADLCENGQTCIAVCPEDVFALRDGRVVVAEPSRCTACFDCAENCSSGAIEIDC